MNDSATPNRQRDPSSSTDGNTGGSGQQSATPRSSVTRPSPILAILRQSWLVMLLATVLGGALAGVERGLQPRIQQQAEARLLTAILEVVPGGTNSQKVDLPEGSVYRVIDDFGAPRGWAIPATVTGFVDKIELLIGLSADTERILGLAILQSKETPGLGDRIRESDFREQFRNQSAEIPLEVLKPGQSAPHGIDAIAGATISTWAVVRGVREQLERMRPQLKEASGNMEALTP